MTHLNVVLSLARKAAKGLFLGMWGQSCFDDILTQKILGEATARV